MRLRKLFVATLLSAGLWCAPVQALEVGPIDIHGSISQGYIKSSANDYLMKSEKGSYEFNESAINFSTSPSDNLRIGLQLLARDLGDAGNNEVVLDWGYADYRVRNELGIRLGKLKVPFGLYNEGRDVDMLRTNVFLPQSIYVENMRGFWNAMEGGALYGNVGMGPVGTLEYITTLGGTSVKLDNTAFNKTLSLALLFEEDIDDAEVDVRYINANRLVWNTPLEGLRLGWTQSYTRSKVTTEHIISIPVTLPGYPYPVMYDMSFPYTVAMKFRIQVLSGEYKWQGLTLAGEYYTSGLGVDIEMPTIPSTPLQGGTNSAHRTMLGYYGLASYRLTDWLEIGAYRGIYYTNTADRDGEEMRLTDAAMGHEVRPDFAAWQKDTCGTVRFDINPNWLIKLEAHHMNGTAQVTNYSSADDLKKIWSLYAVKTTFSF